jgi:hypothetical protein
MTFGAEPQRRMNAFLDDMLKGVRTDEAGVAGELIVELAGAIKGINLPKMKEEVAGQGGIAGALARLPVSAHISRPCAISRRLARRYTSTSTASRRRRPSRWDVSRQKTRQPTHAPARHS